MWQCARIVTPRADGLRPARVAPMLRRRSGPALHVVAFLLRRIRACRGSSPALCASGWGSGSSPFSLHKVGAASCRARCLSPTPTRLRHPAFAGPPPRLRFALGWGRRRVSASGPVRPCAARRPCRAVLSAAISRPFAALTGRSPTHAVRRAIVLVAALLRRDVTPGGAGPAPWRASPVWCGRHEWAWRLPPPRGEGGKHHADIVPKP